MAITITAFDRSPDGGRGLARDTRVRWALEEAGLPYEVRLLSPAAMKEPGHLALQPFGQIPTLQDGATMLFETGAIVLHVAGRCAALLPPDPGRRARAISWLFAALNTVEPPILELSTARIVEGDRPWTRERLPLIHARIAERLRPLADRLSASDWLDGAFSAGDLMMVSVLLRLRMSGLLDREPALAAYVARGEARPAYQRAYAASSRSTLDDPYPDIRSLSQAPQLRSLVHVSGERLLLVALRVHASGYRLLDGTEDH